MAAREPLEQRIAELERKIGLLTEDNARLYKRINRAVDGAQEDARALIQRNADLERQLAEAKDYGFAAGLKANLVLKQERIADLERQVAEARKDSERIDKLERIGCRVGLIHDDDSRWVCSGSGFQPISEVQDGREVFVTEAAIGGVWSFCVEAGEVCYIPLAHVYPGAPDQLGREAVLERLRPWFESAERRKVGQNAKYDRHVLANHGVDVRGVVHDTLLASYVLESHQRHDIDSLAMRHLGAKTILYEEVAGKGASSICFDQVSVERATEYSAENSDVTFQLHGALWPRIEADAKLRHGYCVNHEVDVIARNNDTCSVIECKYHSDAGIPTDVKTALYVHARVMDIQKNTDLA